MAAIDKIYGTREQWNELFEYLKYNQPMFCRFLYNPPVFAGPIANFSEEADMYLYEHCDIEWVKEALHEQYGGNLKTRFEKWQKRKPEPDDAELNSRPVKLKITSREKGKPVNYED